ncbi:PcfU [Enterococcus sp. AZ102]|uniref:PcfU n=1 Tax=Enterococcus sp. AZ102 TaxID=2774865 RepID=UPI003F1E6B18
MDEQLSLFESTDKKFRFRGYYCNDDWSIKTKVVGTCKNIVDTFEANLTAEELKKLCDKAVKVKLFNYGYEIFYEEYSFKKALIIRFENHTSSKKRSVYEHIDLYFEDATF